LITSKLCWRPGSGHSIEIGHDRILGMDASVTLSPQLISYLQTKNINYLFQIRNSCRSDALPDSWIPTYPLDSLLMQPVNGMNTGLALSQLGIHLTATEDQLHWSGGDRSGNLTAQNVYAEISNSHWLTNLSGWKNRF
jgi:hypothetical protein